MNGRRIQRDRKGGYRLSLPSEERELLASLPAQLREVLQTLVDDDLVAPYPEHPVGERRQRVLLHQILRLGTFGLGVVDQRPAEDPGDVRRALDHASAVGDVAVPARGR